MPFDASHGENAGPRQRFAVIGSGIAGLSAAWLLSSRHEVVLYEAAGRLGGHTNTVDVPLSGGRTIPVDAGFIVYNEPAYPNLTAMFAHLGIASEETCMSFGASMRGGEIEYSGQTLSSVFADRRKAVSPRYWRMLADIAKFHRDARRALRDGLDEAETLEGFVTRSGYGRSFVRDFLKPMASAIWSTPSDSILDYAAAPFIRFYENHGLLQVLNLPVWHTVSGGARNYVDKLAAPLSENLRIWTPVRRVVRAPGGVDVIDVSGHGDRFDGVVIAAHGDEALAMVDAPADDERALLSAFRYQQNRAVVHFDAAHMPRRRRAWSSWNYIGGETRAEVTYWMNRLQNLECREDIFVTLNPDGPVREEAVVAEFDYAHPMFNLEVAKAQRNFWRIQGRGGVWYCGAHFGQGFHEDGLQAGLAAAEEAGGVRRPWCVANESGRIHLAPGKVAA